MGRTQRIMNKLSSLTLSDNTNQRRIEEKTEDIKNQVVEQIKQLTVYVLQLDESTDVSSCAHFMVQCYTKLFTIFLF